MDVLPTFLVNEVSAERPVSGYKLNFQENSLRVGQVVGIRPPTDPQNASKRYYEYDVRVMSYNSNGTPSSKLFRNCVMADGFGGVADSYTHTPRAAGNVRGNITNGSLVALLCVDDNTKTALIIGGYPNPNLPTTSEDLGHHLSFEFNGVQFNIDKDGQVAIKRRGPTNDDGTVISGQEENGGATVLMTTDGSVSIQSGNGNQVKVDLDATNGSLNLTCTEGVVINSGSQSMVQGENLAASITTLMTTIATNVAAIAPNGAAIAGVINGAMANFRSSDFLSTKNKVD